MTPNVAVCLRSSLCSPSAPASPPSSPSLPPPTPPVPSPSPPSSLTVGRRLLFLHVCHLKPHHRLSPPLCCCRILGKPHRHRCLSLPLPPCRRRRHKGPHGPHSSPSPSASSPSSSTRRSLLPKSPSQPSTSASSFFSVSFTAPQRPSHRRLLSLFPDGLFSSVSPASTPSIVGRILLLRRRSLLPPWPGSRRLPPLVPPSRANASSVPASQSSVNPVVADARSSLPPFSSLSSAAPRLRHCRAEKTASTSFAAAFLSDTGIDLLRFWYADSVRFSVGYAYIMIFLL